MARQIIIIVIILVVIPIIPAYSQQSPLTVYTDKSSYYTGERVRIYGTTPTVDLLVSQPISINVIDPNGNIWINATIYTDKKGNYTYLTDLLPSIEGRWTVTTHSSYTDSTEFDVKLPTADISFDKDRYIMNEYAIITLVYQGPNDNRIIDQKDIIVYSNTSRIRMILEETSYNTNIFVGKILLTNNAHNENELEVKYGDTITAVYSDQFINVEASAKINTPPVIVYDVIKDDKIMLDASKSYDADNDNLRFIWKQISGERIDYTDNNSWIEFDAPKEEITFTLTISDGYEEVSEDITIIPPLSTSISIPIEVYEDFNIIFKAQTFGGEEPYSYSWNIDGENIREESFTRAFDAGTYDITLVVTDSRNQARDSKQLSIYKPIIKIAGDKIEGSTIKFSIEPLIDDASYSWNIDGSKYQGSTIAYTFDNDGNYTVTLSIRHLNQIKEYEEEIKIDNVEPIVSLSIDKKKIEEGEQVRFTINIDDPGNDTFTIILYSNNKPVFKTETTSRAITYEHIYETAGTYEHYVIVNDNKDSFESEKIDVTVETSLSLPLLSGIGGTVAGSSIIIYKIVKKLKPFVSMEVEYKAGIDKNIRFYIDTKGGIEE